MFEKKGINQSSDSGIPELECNSDSKVTQEGDASLESPGELNKLAKYRNLIYLLILSALTAYGENVFASSREPEYYDISSSLLGYAQSKLRFLPRGEGYIKLNNKIYVVKIEYAGILSISKYGHEEEKLPVEIVKYLLFQITQENFLEREAVQEELKKIDAKYGDFRLIKRSLKERYDVGFYYKDVPDDINANPRGKKAATNILRSVDNTFDMFPGFMIRDSKLGAVYAVKDLKDKKGHSYGGMSSRDSIYLTSGSKRTIVHELYHVLDSQDDRFLTDNDNDIWSSLNPNGKRDYVYQHGGDAIANPQEFRKGGRCHEVNEGFVKQYSYCGGPDEDQATVTDSLFTASTNPKFLERLKTDKVLLDKVEMITGCKFDPEQMKFSRFLRRHEYKERFKTEDYEYFAKWSKNLMNPRYWNAVIKGQSVSFKRVKNGWALVVNK